ncbi:MAG: GNAT family acetyltransferase [Chloroflexi bacterium]|nr:GNAT family acetyltransferase [Chloroflexota bacterium]
MTLEYHIRQFHFDDDYEPVLALWKSVETGMQVGRSDSPEEIRKKIQRDPDLFLVAETKTQIIGTVIGGFDGRRGMVYHLAVHQEFRRNGVAKNLLADLETRLQAKGCLKVYLLVLADNTAAMCLYEECGWKRQPADLVFSKEF